MNILRGMLIALLIFPVQIAHATCTTRVRTFTVPTYNNYSYNNHHDYKVSVVTIPVATFLPIPLYTASFAPPAPVAASAVTNAATNNDARILRVLESIETRLQALEKRNAIAPVTPPVPLPADPKRSPAALAPPTAPLSGLSVMQGKCIQCHESKVAEDFGGGLSLFNGKDLSPTITDKQWVKVIQSATKGTMPKQSKDPSHPVVAALTDEESFAIVSMPSPVK